ncbi:hypothetical protein T01_749 [Trichinella spiralis]|uniref:Uncharacterized protein n=1 Tax=Trichinella spiralis TaxID=6334 RepID=A0A0V1APQ6_TRISP|nr:hypothetical protein T01_749 [Trichinella spiralis]
MLHEKPGIDKSIVPYFGHHPAMFMKGKLIRLRYKAKKCEALYAIRNGADKFRKKCFFENSKFRGLETWLFLRKLATMAAWHIHYYIENRPLIQLDFVAMLSSACYSHTEKHH